MEPGENLYRRWRPHPGISWQSLGVSEALADEIVLRVPASVEYARVVRVAAAAVALRQGMSFTEIDELRAAVDQATELLLEQPAASEASIECIFRAQGGCLEMEARRTDEAGVADTAAARFKKAVGAANVSASVESDRGWLLLRKPVGRPGSRPAA